MSIIGHKGIQVLSDIDSLDDLPEAADVESEAVWYIESGDFAPDYIAPSLWDGQQFNEWISLVDGEVFVALPDSGLLHRWDVSEEDDISTVSDLSGSADLDAIGSPSIDTDGINGVQAALLDGTDDGFESDLNALNLSQPFEIFFVAERDSTKRMRAYTTGQDDGETVLSDWSVDDGDTEYRLVAGNGISGGTPDQNPHFTTALCDGNDGVLRVDGTTIASGDVGSNNLNDIRVGVSRLDSRWFSGHWGELLIYDPTDNGYDRTEVENYLSNKWGIPI